jgi:hypothetical protein
MCSKGNINYSMQNIASVTSRRQEGKCTRTFKNISLIKNAPWKGLRKGAVRLTLHRVGGPAALG